MFLGIDRSTMGRFDDPNGHLMTTHSWAVAGVDALPTTLEESSFPYLARQMRGGKPVILERISDLPAGAAVDTIALPKIGLKSVATFPLAAEGKVLRWLSFGALRAERAWSDRLVRRLRLIGNIFANAVLHRQKEEELRHALADNVGSRNWCRSTARRCRQR